MKSFIAFFKKECLESVRGGKLLFLGILFFAFGVMNPAIAKLTPWLLEMLSEELSESGMTVVGVEVNALTSWTQFFKNIPMALIAFVLLYASAFTKEYEKGTLILMLTKGLSRYKVVLAKALYTLVLWTAGYWLCFAVTYAYNAYYWDNSVATGLWWAVLYWWVFGLLCVSLTVLFGVVCSSYSGVVLGTGGVVFLSYLLGLIPRLKTYMPTSLMNGNAIAMGVVGADTYCAALVIALVLCVGCIGGGVAIFNRKQL